MMIRSILQNRSLRWLFWCLFFLSMITCGCKSNLHKKANIRFSYKPLLLPFRIVVDSQGKLMINLEASWITPVGEFAINSADYSLFQTSNSRVVVIRDDKKQTDKVLLVSTKSSKSKKVSERDGPPIVVDVSDAPNQSISFERSGDYSKVPLIPSDDAELITSSNDNMLPLTFVYVEQSQIENRRVELEESRHIRRIQSPYGRGGHVDRPRPIEPPRQHPPRQSP